MSLYNGQDYEFTNKGGMVNMGQLTTQMEGFEFLNTMHFKTISEIQGLVSNIYNDALLYSFDIDHYEEVPEYVQEIPSKFHIILASSQYFPKLIYQHYLKNDPETVESWYEYCEDIDEIYRMIEEQQAGSEGYDLDTQYSAEGQLHRDVNECLSMFKMSYLKDNGGNNPYRPVESLRVTDIANSPIVSLW